MLGADTARLEGFFIHRAERRFELAEPSDHRKKCAAELCRGPAPHDRGASIQVRGALVASQGKGQSWEIVANEIENHW